MKVTMNAPQLGGVITWSWWWVTAPIWGGLLAVLFLIAALVAADRR